MFPKFLDWLDGFLLEEGARGIVRAALGLMSFGAVLAVLFGDVAVRAGVMIAAILVVLALMVTLTGDRRRLIGELEEQKHLVRAYADALWEQHSRNFRVLSWEQTAYIEPNGDTREFIVIHAVIEGQDAPFVRLRFGAGWPQPKRYQRKVSVNVRSVDVNGRTGARFPTTKDWMPDGRISVLAHFITPAAVGTDVRLRMEWFWPGKSVPLTVRRGPDNFTFKFGNPVERAVYRVILPLGAKVYWEPVGFRIGDGVATIDVDEQGERTQVTVEVQRMPVRRHVGVRLELKK